MYQEVQQRLKSRPREFRAGDVGLSQAHIGKARRLLGYRSVQPVSEDLARALDGTSQISRRAVRSGTKYRGQRPHSVTRSRSVRRDTDFVLAVAK